MIYSKPKYKSQYENFIGGEWVAPKSGEYFENISPVDGKLLTRIPRSNEEDVELAIQAAKKAFESFKHTSIVERSTMLNKVADAGEKSNRMIKDAEKTIEVQREKALSDMESQVAELAMSAAAKILGEDSNDAKNQSLYDEFIEKAGEAHDTESN
jgi:acyl-CoA reductase-like NAD-dependent aldehyde dehydrogenase